MFQRGDGRPGELRKWLAASGPTIALLALIFFLALFVRAYFGYDLAQDNGYLVSGGSDSYYWQHIIDYSSNTGKQLFWDPLINWPDGIRNPRPPMYSFSIVVPAVFTQGFYASLEDAWGAQLMWSTAFWGALTVIPTYFLGKEAFGRRAGIVAAFFLAVMPSHVQRSVLSDADHDAFILFFIVLTFYFVLKAVKAQQHKRWVENWRDLKSVRKGFTDYFRGSRTAVLYAAMAGVSYACIIMAWVGFGYATVLILAYYVIQVLLNKFKNIDSMSVTVLIFIAMGVGFLLSYPVYYEQNLIAVRFDVPVYLWAASMFLGAMFVVSRDYPWTMVLPAVVLILASLIVVIDLVNPALAEAILSGQGYFVKSKLYSTIAEARAPIFSELALSFGMVTFFMSLIGMIWAIWKLPKHIAAEYIFMVVWLAAAIFMAISAGRFMFNASPAFAMAAGWVTVILVDRLNFGGVRKSLSGASGSYWQIFKKSVKVRHMVGALFLGFMIVLPNVWYSMDAGIPQEIKSDYDKQIYTSIPKALRPDGYDAVNGTSWYLGAFGYSVPLQRYYFPAAWSWFAEQDNTTYPIESRPAYVAWWDYGFEAVQAGKHPTVADNFQNGYQLTGNAIVSQSEEEAIAIFSYRLIQAAYNEGGSKGADVQALLERYGMSRDHWNDIINGPAQPIIDAVLADPAKYGLMASDLTAPNARIVQGRVELASLGADKLVGLYSELCDVTGWEIRYFDVDSRMFPTSAQNTGIFYAPAKLADRRITGSSTPVDFFNIVGIDDNGETHDVDNITGTMNIIEYKITYKDMFYDSMFYRAMVGYSGTDIGQTNDGIPGLSGSGSGALDNYQAMPGWNLAHFRMVYRTAYFNPYPSDQLAGHSGDWRALNLEDAVDLKGRIDAKEIEGTVDTSSAALYSAGTVFLKYYDGAFVNGTLTTEEGHPVAGVRVTILDEWGIPHDSALTDAQGQYSLLAPFGPVTLVFSTGALQGLTQTGETSITNMKFNVTDDQAMRRPLDLDLDGVYDYIITKDYVMPGTQITGDVFWDVNSDGNYSAETDLLINGTVIRAHERFSGQDFTFNATDGTFDTKLPPGQYDIIATVLGRDLGVAEKFNVSGKKTETKLPIKPSVLNGHVANVDGTDASNLMIEMLDLTSGMSTGVRTDSEGNYSFQLLLGGKYSMITTAPGLVLFNLLANITEGATLTRNITVFPSANITARITSNGVQVPYTSWMLVSNYNPIDVISGVTDEFGVVKMRAPKGLWTLYASQSQGSNMTAGAVLVDLTASTEVEVFLDAKPAATVSGMVLATNGLVLPDAHVSFVSANGARVKIVTDAIGAFKLALQEGTYDVVVNSVSAQALFSGKLTVALPRTSIRIQMTEGVRLSGSVWLLKDTSELPSASNLGRFAAIEITDPSSRVFTTQADSEGSYNVAVPKGSTVTVTVADPGYSDWSASVMITKTTDDFSLIAEPDEVQVGGRLTSDGIGIRGVEIEFVPVDLQHEVVSVTTGADGAYSATVPPARYTVSVDQATGPTGAERYLFSQSQIVSPSSVPLPFDIAVAKKVQAVGNVLGGGATGIQIKFTGPEEQTIQLTSTNYSVLLLPGEYDVYASVTSSGVPFAKITQLSITAATRTNDIVIERAYGVTGTITLPSGPTFKAVTVRATAPDGAFVEVRSSSSGRYALNLPPGMYSMSFLLEDAVTQAGRAQFIEYTGVKTVQVVSSDVLADIRLERRLDNTTFSGRTVGPDGQPFQATVQMTATGVYGQNATFTSDATGAFSVSLQPGDYVLYAVRLQDKHATISSLSLTRNIPLSHNISLVDARVLSGKATVEGVGASLPIDLTGLSGSLDIESDSEGNFNLLVPPGNYTLMSSTRRTENTITVTYSIVNAFPVGSSDVFIALDLQRETRRGVIATWNTSDVKEAAVGSTVSYAVTLTNTGNVEDRFLVTFTGERFDVSFSPAELQVGFGVDNTAIVIVTISPQDTVPVGEQSVTCLVRSLDFATTRADLVLKVQMLPHRGVLVKSLGTSSAVNSLTTVTSFAVNNTGNAGDDFGLSISNLGALRSLGWTAVMIDPTTGEEVSATNIAAFGSKTFQVKFTALRPDADPAARATVFAYSKNMTTADAYGDIPIKLPDLKIGKGDLNVSREDISLEDDAGARLATNVALLIALVALIVVFYILRRRKGYGRPSKGGAKK